MASLHITPAVLPDLPCLAALLAGPGAMQEAISTAESGLRYALEHPHCGGVWVMRDGATLLGCVSLFETISTAEGGPVALLQDLVVAAECRRRGYGKRLLSHAIAEATARGLHRITLVPDALPPETRRFFQNHGFADSGMIPLRQTFLPQSSSSTKA